jgi:hypothetical protein
MQLLPVRCWAQPRSEAKLGSAPKAAMSFGATHILGLEKYAEFAAQAISVIEEE